MAHDRDSLPQLSAEPFLTDSGLETTLIFHDGYALPDFAAFVLLDDEAGKQRLLRYFREHADVAAANGVGFIFESPTWRASADWGARLSVTLLRWRPSTEQRSRCLSDCVERLKRPVRRRWSAVASVHEATATTALR
ncbi:MAG: hypothetical protein WKF73_07825 [Nocardioidaceae bacterium]